MVRRRRTQEDLETAIGMDRFVFTKPSQVLDNLHGEWRLQLMADKRGDRVEFFNTTLIWQNIDTMAMMYIGGSKELRLTVAQSGMLEFDQSGRILSRVGGVSPSIGRGGGGGGICYP